ncbi:MAG TPA: Xaa-Pro peptidase family protein [Gaiellaceae bacterium]|nr:Xaa-Pro peptidase family protein [Gaiellaceae bacterium]
MFDYATRRARLAEQMEKEGVDALFLAPSADLEYLTGLERQIPFFGELSYAHGWITGAFFRPERDPVFLFPRMFARLDLHEEPEGEIVVVNETDDGFAAFERVVRGLGNAAVVAVGDRVWAETVLNLGRAAGSFDRLRTGSRLVNELRRVKTTEELEAMGRAIAAAELTMDAVTPLVVPGVTMAQLVESVEHELREAGSRCPSFTTHIFTGLTDDDYDSGLPSGRTPIHESTSVMFDFGGVVDGYCSDFGRTIYCGDPPDHYREAYEIMLAAQEAGRAAARAGTPARGVNAACRAPIEEAGLGEHFRHRMGHCIGLDIHERPFISEEDETPLQPGMTFTDEPSILIPGRYSLRIEDILVCEEAGGRKLNSYPPDLVSSTAKDRD